MVSAAARAGRKSRHLQIQTLGLQPSQGLHPARIPAKIVCIAGSSDQRWPRRSRGSVTVAKRAHGASGAGAAGSDRRAHRWAVAFHRCPLAFMGAGSSRPTPLPIESATDGKTVASERGHLPLVRAHCEFGGAPAKPSLGPLTRRTQPSATTPRPASLPICGLEVGSAADSTFPVCLPSSSFFFSSAVRRASSGAVRLLAMRCPRFSAVRNGTSTRYRPDWRCWFYRRCSGSCRSLGGWPGAGSTI